MYRLIGIVRDGALLLVQLSDNLFARVKSDQFPQNLALAISQQLGDNHGLQDQAYRKPTEASARRPERGD